MKLLGGGHISSREWNENRDIIDGYYISFEILEANIFSFEKGDLNGDGDLDQEDLAIALQVLIGNDPLNIRPDYITSDADVDGDNKIGIEELIYIQQRILGVRSP